MSIHILFPVDKSQYAEAAGSIGIQLAKVHDARLTLLRVLNVKPASGNFLEDLAGRMGFGTAIVSDELVEEREARAKALVGGWAKRAAEEGVDAHTEVPTGAVAATIHEHAQDVDLVVMGLRGETEERFPKQGGEMSSWLPPRIETPTLWATPGAAPITAVALGYDGSEAAKHAVRATRQFLVPLGVPVHAFFITEDGTGGEILADLEESLDDCEWTAHVIHTDAAPHLALVEHALAVGAQVLVLGFNGGNPLKNFVFGSSTERVLAAGNLAVLVTR